MTKLFTAAALVTAMLAAPAFAKDATGERSFSRDGETYVYTTAIKGDARLISGTSASGKAFSLTVRNGHVSGFSGGVPVSFDVKQAAPDSVALAAR